MGSVNNAHHTIVKHIKRKEYEDLLKRVAAYKIFGEDADIEFFNGRSKS